MKQKIKLSRKGQATTIGLVFGVIIVSLMVPLVYTALQPVYTTTGVSNETVTIATVGTGANLVNYDAIAGSEKVYNATNTSQVAVGEGAASGTECGENKGCYYNFTDGNKYTKPQLFTNLTGAYFVTYNYYPPAYSKSAVDRSVVLFIGTFMLLGAIVAVAKNYGLM